MGNGAGKYDSGAKQSSAKQSSGRNGSASSNKKGEDESNKIGNDLRHNVTVEEEQKGEEKQGDLNSSMNHRKASQDGGSSQRPSFGPDGKRLNLEGRQTFLRSRRIGSCSETTLKKEIMGEAILNSRRVININPQASHRKQRRHSLTPGQFAGNMKAPAPSFAGPQLGPGGQFPVQVPVKRGSSLNTTNFPKINLDEMHNYNQSGSGQMHPSLNSSRSSQQPDYASSKMSSARSEATTSTQKHEIQIPGVLSKEERARILNRLEEIDAKIAELGMEKTYLEASLQSSEAALARSRGNYNETSGKFEASSSSNFGNPFASMKKKFAKGMGSSISPKNPDIVFF